jgi:hypothetical protein
VSVTMFAPGVELAFPSTGQASVCSRLRRASACPRRG